jgi:hypothetical protein
MTVSLISFNLSVFVTENQCVFCVVRTESFKVHLDEFQTSDGGQ